MKKILLSLIITIATATVWAQQTAWPTSAPPGSVSSPTTPRNNGTADSLNTKFYLGIGQYFNQFYTAAQVNQLLTGGYIKAGGSGNARGLFLDGTNKAYVPGGFSYNVGTNSYNFSKALSTSVLTVGNTATFNNTAIFNGTVNLGGILPYLATNQHLVVDGSGNINNDSTTYVQENGNSILNGILTIKNGQIVIDTVGSLQNQPIALGGTSSTTGLYQFHDPTTGYNFGLNISGTPLIGYNNTGIFLGGDSYRGPINLYGSTIMFGGSGTAFDSAPGSGLPTFYMPVYGVDAVLPTQLVTLEQLTGGYQPILVSGTNIKTVNSQSLIGSGNIVISGGFTPSGTTDETLAGDGSNVSNLNYALIDKSYPTPSGSYALTTATPNQSTGFTYSSGNYTATSGTAYVLMNGSLGSTISGEIRTTYASSANQLAVLGIDVNNTFNNFNSPWYYQLYADGSTYYYAENSGVGTSSGISVVVGDIIRLRRDGSTGIVYAEKSIDGGTTFTLIHQFTTTNTGLVYYKLAGVSSGNVASNVQATIDVVPASFANNDLLFYNSTATTFNNVSIGNSLSFIPITLPGIGGVSDGSTDNYASFNTANTIASGKPIYFPQNSAGNANYNFATAPTISGNIISADANVILTTPSTNGVTFSNSTLTTPLKIFSSDRNNTALEQANNMPDWVSKATDNVYEQDNIQQPQVVNATLFSQRQYNTGTSGFISGQSTLTASNQVTWATSSITNANAIDVVGGVPIIGNMYTCSTSPSTNSGTRFGVLVDIGGGLYTYFSIDANNKWYLGQFNGTSYSESTGVLLPTAAYGISSSATTIVSYRIISANNIEFYVNGVFVSKYSEPSPMAYVGVGWYDTSATSSGAVYAYDFVSGFSQTAYSGNDIIFYAFGDSITSGEGSDLSWPNTLKWIVEGKRGIGKCTVYNYGNSGYTAAQEYTVMQGITLTPGSYVGVMVGTNDIQAQTSMSSFKTTIANIITYIKAAGCIPIIAIPPTFISQSLTGYGYATANYQLGGNYRSAIIRVAAEQGGCYMADVNSAIGEISATNQQLRDNIHPQPAYMGGVIANEFVKSLMSAMLPAKISNTSVVTAPYSMVGSSPINQSYAGAYLATLTGSETLINKTLTSPQLNSPLLNTTSTVGNVWTATGTNGSGNWAIPTIPNKSHTIFTPTTGSTVTLVNNQYNIINPSGALLALTINLPSSPVDKDEVRIKFTQTISTVTYANGTVVDGITAPTAGGLTILVFDSSTSSWY